MNVENLVQNTVVLTKADFVEAVTDFLKKNNAKGNLYGPISLTPTSNIQNLQTLNDIDPVLTAVLPTDY
jgi:hypothetical protein